jgi:hypothetical protein
MFSPLEIVGLTLLASVILGGLTVVVITKLMGRHSRKLQEKIEGGDE